jgi:phosphoribosyl 1,2-cyclic phosphodiesterase
MFEIKIHATGSKGNAYSIIDGDHKILIDPGIRFKELQKATGFSLAAYDFVLLSHEHKDHSKAIPELLRIGLDCYMSQGTRDALSLTHTIILPIRALSDFERDGWRILPFDVEHDAAEPLGFLILSPSGKKICYASDTYYVRYNFNGVTHWLIEANYSEELLQQNNSLPEDTKLRIRTSHFEIKNVVKFFEMQDLEKTEMIYLIHLSDDNSDAKIFVETIKNLTGKSCETSKI